VWGVDVLAIWGIVAAASVMPTTWLAPRCRVWSAESCAVSRRIATPSVARPTTPGFLIADAPVRRRHTTAMTGTVSIIGGVVLLASPRPLSRLAVAPPTLPDRAPTWRSPAWGPAEVARPTLLPVFTTRF
jgi:hypothetical protein